MVVRPSSKVLFLLAVAMGLVLGAAVERASACTCVGRYPACRAFGDSAAVFLGEVVAIADVSRTMDVGGRSVSYRQKRVHFRVSEAFRGTTETELDVLTGVGDGDCGYPFVVGRRYVVFASDGSGAFSTGICQPTQMEAEAEATLAYLRARSGPSRGARVYGTATFWNDDPGTPGGTPQRGPYGGARVVVSGDAGTFETRTSTDGAFEVFVPAGSYDVSAEPEVGMYADVGIGPRPLNLPDAHACTEIGIAVRWDGHVIGKLRDRQNMTVEGVPVQLIPAGQPNRNYSSSAARADSQSTFEIGRISPGNYLAAVYVDVGLPYPRILLEDPSAVGQPKVITVGPGERVNLGEVRLPVSVRMHKLGGSVVDESGKPIRGAVVDVTVLGSASARRTVAKIQTDETGHFALMILDGHRHEVSTIVRTDPTQIVAASVTLDPDASNVTLVIRR